MKHRFYLCLCVLCALCLCACTAAYSGLDGNIMYTNTNPDVAVVPKTGLLPLQSGTFYTNLESDSNLKPRLRVHYVVYGDKGEGPVKRHAHVMITDILDRYQFNFVPQTFSGRNELSLSGTKIEGRGWSEHVRYEGFEGDWFTRWWTLNDRRAPQTWIGKRWSRDEDPVTRIVVEYREPLPECASIQERQIMFIFSNIRIDTPTMECKEEVDAVFKRADEAFSIQRSSRMKLGTAAPANVLTQFPKGAMDTARHIGTAQMISHPVD